MAMETAFLRWRHNLLDVFPNPSCTYCPTWEFNTELALQKIKIMTFFYVLRHILRKSGGKTSSWCLRDKPDAEIGRNGSWSSVSPAVLLNVAYFPLITHYTKQPLKAINNTTESCNYSHIQVNTQIVQQSTQYRIQIQHGPRLFIKLFLFFPSSKHLILLPFILPQNTIK